MMINCSISLIQTLFQSAHFILTIIIISSLVKIYLLTILIPHGLRSSKIHKPWIFLLGALIGSLFGDLAWIIKLVRDMQLISVSYGMLVFFVRISWSFMIFQYQNLGFFFESLTKKNFMLNRMHKLLLCASGFFSLYFLFEAFFDAALTDPLSRNQALKFSNPIPPFEITAMQYVSFYLVPALTIPSLVATFGNLYKASLPQLLKNQIKIVLLFFICPYLLIEALQIAQFLSPLFQSNLYPIVAFSTLLLTCATIYCIPKVIGLRFLNFESTTLSTYNIHFMNNFKELLEQFSQVTSFKELTTLTQTFFHSAFDIPARKARLIFMDDTINVVDSNNAHSLVTHFLHNSSRAITNFIKQRPILIYDDLEFTNFYDESEERTTILAFLENINAEIFIPIYSKNNLIAYIIIEPGNPKYRFFGSSEQNEMLVFASYLASNINLLQHRSLETLLHKEKELKEELHRKEQEIHQYKESLKSFLRDSNKREMGIIFYKNRRFMYANKAAKQLIPINLNMQEGHPLTKTIKNLVVSVTTYKTPQSSIATDSHEKKIVLYAVPNLEQNTIILMVYYPEISDLIARNIGLLKDPTKWDYLLYLETTQSGQLINQLIPGTGETLLNFKIDLLKMALSKQAILLTMPEEDLMATVEIIHHISVREILHVLELKKNNNAFEIASQIFGTNALFDKSTTKSLLSSLDSIGTLFIKNIEYLDLETQEYLADFLKYGVYRVFRADTKYVSHVRIICSTQNNLEQLVKKGTFSKNLYTELNNLSLSMPSLSTLPEQELQKLAEGLTQQALKTNDLQNFLALTDREKSKLIYNRPVSLHDLRNKIQEIVVQKTETKNIGHTIHHACAEQLDDPELRGAAQLGKKALRNENIMRLLWNKFQNQNKIALFLGVNRSSINRRCKEYNLQ